MKKFRVITKIGDKLVAGHEAKFQVQFNVLEIIRDGRVFATFNLNEIIGVLEEV